ncbi:hypothetical protein [Streptomyces sp. NPDC001744]|uniref:hypothetical protein n=1 Tax=Streptomyces sp. NPDC001744 TaxID=3364606 RepID=UPI0036A0BBB7
MTAAGATPKRLLALQVVPGRVLEVDTADGRVRTLVEDAGDFPDGVVTVDGAVYWTTMGTPDVDPGTPGEGGYDFSRRNGGVHAWNPGGPRRDLVPAGARTTGKQPTSDGAGALYRCDREGHRISRVRTDGSGLTDLVVTPAAEGITGECVGIAIDTAAGLAYVADLDGHIREVPLPDGPVAGRAPREVAALGTPLTGLCLP